MTLDEFKTLVRKIDRKGNALMFGVKHEDYTRNDDKLHNFKKAGTRRDTTPEYALAGMLEKHLTSIDDMINDLEFDGVDHTLKEWDAKLIDAINYFKLLRALIEERYTE